MREAVGVIGGLGPAATAYFLERVIDFTQADCDQAHINMMIFNHCTIGDRTAYISGASSENPLPLMIEDAQDMVALGCRFIVIPCNTAHYFYEDIQAAVEIPVVNIVRETLRYASCQAQDPLCIGIMATDGTIMTESYQKAAEESGCSWVTCDPAMQKKLMDMIYQGVKAGQPVALADFEEIANHLRQKGANCLVLGCTELSVLKRDLALPDEDVIDSIDVLALETVRRSGKPMTAAALRVKGVKCR